MKITAQEEYGIRCILRLAGHKAPTPLTVKSIAESEGLSTAYVEKLLRILKKSGLTQSARGVKGGYALAKSPERISVGEVIHALGGGMTTEDICHKFTGERPNCIHLNNCCLRPVWKITQRIEEFLYQTLLSSLITGDEQMVQAGLLEKARVLHA